MDVMDREKTGDAQLSCHCRNQAGHPIVAMDEIRPHIRDDVVDNLPLKSKGDLNVFYPIIRVNMVHIEKGSVFGKVDPFVRHSAPDAVQLPYDKGRGGRWNASAKYGTVIRKSHVNVGPLLEQSAYQRR